eukprot:CAMPEP_0201550302 /NCGR_PEP_ID=MMETSP0173_2-20130828/6677_1 /ASSEMBLY_ACC=CAM_ASM_000268 /TAXON_ID=218659 /ORGANISM="Vexillifera sp., Strain DIVA3 564/2" /LENGTH=423 /DNA_ID=CAMNT_0047960237 /DNA_START=235 /DNA_END=1506 /DNA_ORIENTATION=+
MKRHPKQLTSLVSGSADGEIRQWNLASQTTNWSVNAHKGFVRGVCFCYSSDGLDNRILSCGTDKTIKCWNLDKLREGQTSSTTTTSNAAGSSASHASSLLSSSNTTSTGQTNNTVISGVYQCDRPAEMWLGEHAFYTIDDQRETSQFATASASKVDVWDYERSSPIDSYEWGYGSVIYVAFNPIQHNVLGACTSDREVVLYDTRASSGVRKVSLSMRSNQLAWNPMEAFNFSVANEDRNVYTFDMRKLSRAINIQKDHLDAVTSLDYSPTGRELVTGSYDCTIRLYQVNSSRSRDVYHTKRMQRVFAVQFSGDARFVFSGSDDTNIRVWKSGAADHIGTMTLREKRADAYKKKLKKRFKHVPEVRSIANHQHLPKPLYRKRLLDHEMKSSKARKNRNKRVHMRPENAPKWVHDKQKVIEQQIQ